ncbi:MAG: hypothetical protein ACK5X9_19135 [Alphaproteobacteria bacterium]
MIRPLTFVSLIVAAGAGLHLYQVKHSVSVLDRELHKVNRQTEEVRERTQILHAEWALLNEPDRLRQVAQRHLALEPMAPAQFIREAELERRLPAARPFAGPPSLFGPPEMPPSVPEALMVPSPLAAAPAPPAAAPARPDAPPRQAQAEPPPRLSAAMAPPPAQRPTPPPAPPRVTPALHVAPAAPPPPAVVTSALGGASAALPPPVPLSRPIPAGAPQGVIR